MRRHDERDAESVRASWRAPAPRRAPSICSSPLPPSGYPPALCRDWNDSGSVWRQQGGSLFEEVRRRAGGFFARFCPLA